MVADEKTLENVSYMIANMKSVDSEAELGIYYEIKLEILFSKWSPTTEVLQHLLHSMCLSLNQIFHFRGWLDTVGAHTIIVL